MKELLFEALVQKKRPCTDITAAWPFFSFKYQFTQITVSRLKVPEQAADFFRLRHSSFQSAIQRQA
jgi:hypothetical protein